MSWTFEDIHREIIFCNIPLNGFYRYNDMFQILQNEVDLPSFSNGINELEPIILEYNASNYTNYMRLHNKVSEEEERFRHYDFSKELRAHLTLILNANFFKEKSYQYDDTQVRDVYSGGELSDRELLSELTTNDEYLLKDTNCIGDLLVKPSFIDNYFSRYFAIDDKAMHRYRMSLMLYYNAIDIREISPSMCYVALISAIENLFDFEGDLKGFKVSNCKNCGTPLFKSTRRFKDFMIEYCPFDSSKYNKILSQIYTRRSKIAHAGSLHYNDYADTELDTNGPVEINIVKMMVRVALVNWILKN